MAVTKILARKNGLRAAIEYVVNGDKTQEQVLTACQRCTVDTAYQVMMDTKQRWGKQGGVENYHIIQSFKPGEVTPEQALEIARAFAEEHLPGYEIVIGVHTDRQHIHAHILFNSVNADTGEKYHSTPQKYYSQIRGISDRLCREHGLSIIMEGQPSKSVTYIEWLRQSKGQPTFRSMLEADLRSAIEDANDLGHFYMLMEHMGYEIRHGSRLGFRLQSQERFMYPERKNRLYSEDGIRAAIQGNMEAIEVGLRPPVAFHPPYRPFRPYPKYTGFLALYVHYLYVLGKIGQREYPPRMTPHLKQELFKFERYREQFAFLRENRITTAVDMTAFQTRTEETLANLIRQRTILNVRKKRRQKLYTALADMEALEPAKVCYEQGVTGIEAEFARYMDAVRTLEGVSKEGLEKEKAEIYRALAQINRKIRAARKKLAMCQDIQNGLPKMERDLQTIENKKKEEVMQDEHRRR